MFIIFTTMIKTRAVTNITEEPLIDNSFLIQRLDDKALATGRPTRLRYHRIILVERGNGSVLIDDRSFKIHGGEVLLLSKGQIYQFGGNTVLRGHSLSFGDCFWERTPTSASNCKAVLFNNTTAHQVLLPSEPELAELITLLGILLAEYQKPDYINQLDALAAYLKVVMIKLANIHTIAETTYDSQDYILYRQFMELLSRQYRRYRSVSDYASMLNITPRRLSDLTKRCAGLGAKEIIDGQVVAEAKRCLQFGSETVKSIAYQLHFNSAEQFSRFFKKKTDISPVDYRNKFVVMGGETRLA